MKRYLDAMVQAARRAGAIVKRTYLSTTLEVKQKTVQGDLVSSADLAAEREILSVLRGAFPQAYMVAEESGGSTVRDRVLHRPVDGTLNFVHGIPFFAVSIGCWVNGVAEAGVVLAPLSGDMYTAVRGQGARKNGKPDQGLHGPDAEGVADSIGWPYDRADRARAVFRDGPHVHGLPGASRLWQCEPRVLPRGGGGFDGYWEWDLKPWDMAAGALIVTEAGGTVTGLSGDALDLASGRVAASNGIIHAELVRAVGGYTQPSPVLRPRSSSIWLPTGDGASGAGLDSRPVRFAEHRLDAFFGRRWPHLAEVACRRYRGYCRARGLPMSKDQVPFYKIPDAPASVGAGGIMGRLVDSVGFRFRWAAEGLVDADLAFKPAPDCMTQAELILHIHDLLASAARNAGLPPESRFPRLPPAARWSRACWTSPAPVILYKTISDTDLAACTAGTLDHDQRAPRGLPHAHRPDPFVAPPFRRSPGSRGPFQRPASEGRLRNTHFLLTQSTNNNLPHVDLAPGKSFKGLLQGHRIKRNDAGDFSLELPFLRPSDGLLQTPATFANWDWNSGSVVYRARSPMTILPPRASTTEDRSTRPNCCNCFAVPSRYEILATRGNYGRRLLVGRRRVGRVIDHVDASPVGQFEDFIHHVLPGIVNDVINMQSMQKVNRRRLAGGTNNLEPMDLCHLDGKMPEAPPAPAM